MIFPKHDTKWSNTQIAILLNYNFHNKKTEYKKSLK